MDKGEVARRLLGTALDMFLRHNQDPVSVHCLAMAGGEIAEGLAKKAGVAPFFDHISATFPDRKIEDIRNIQRQFYNAFKHMFTRDGKERQDQEILVGFDAAINDHALFHGWYDLMLSGAPSPVEAQVFQAWYFSKYREKVNPNADMSRIIETFPNLPALPARRQLNRLLDVIRKTRRNTAVMQHPLTDRRPLVLPRE
jgi:hypothetical protein